MDNICFFISIRQRVCQSGVPVTSENTYTNLSSDDNIILDNGYVLSFSRNIDNNILLTFYNSALNLSFTFTVEDASTTVYDLPIEGGTYRIAVFVTMRCCRTC